MPRESASQAARRVPTFTTAAGSKLKASLNEMMFTMGESIVGLSVWCLRHATNIVKSDKEAGPAGVGSWNFGLSKNFLLDPEALTFTYDLLSYYLKRVQENAPKMTIIPPASNNSTTLAAASSTPAAAAGSTACAAASSTSSAPGGPSMVNPGLVEKEEVNRTRCTLFCLAHGVLLPQAFAASICRDSLWPSRMRVDEIHLSHPLMHGLVYG